MLETTFSTSPTTEPRSRPCTDAATSILRESFSRSMELGLGWTFTVATSPSRTIFPLPVFVSRGRSLIAATLDRVPGVLHTTVSYALPLRKMSPTSSPATRVEAARRTSPGTTRRR